MYLIHYVKISSCFYNDCVLDCRAVIHADILIHLLSFCSLVGPSHCHNSEHLLALTNPEVKRAFEGFFLPAQSDRTRAQLILAGKVCL